MASTSIIEFDPALKFLSSDDQNDVRKCPWFLRQIETRQAVFETSKLLIKGVSFIGEGEKRKILKIDARIYYKNPDKEEASYHVSFLPDSGTLLVVFCVAAENATKPQKNNPNSFQDYHVLLIEQPRWGVNSPNALEPIGGLLTDDEKVDLEVSPKP